MEDVQKFSDLDSLDLHGLKLFSVEVNCSYLDDGGAHRMDNL